MYMYVLRAFIVLHERLPIVCTCCVPIMFCMSQFTIILLCTYCVLITFCMCLPIVCAYCVPITFCIESFKPVPNLYNNSIFVIAKKNLLFIAKLFGDL